MQKILLFVLCVIKMLLTLFKQAPLVSELEWWKYFYRMSFKIVIEIDIQDIPAQPANAEYMLVIVAENVDVSHITFQGEVHEGLAYVVINNDSNSGIYSIWICQSAILIAELQKLSTEELMKKGFRCTTAKEQKLFQLAKAMQTENLYSVLDYQHTYIV